MKPLSNKSLEECKYMIRAFTYKTASKKRHGPMNKQVSYFNNLVKEEIAGKDPNHLKHPIWFLNEFCSKDAEKGYWNVTPDHQTKTNYFLLPKGKRDKFTMAKRLLDSRNFKSKDTRWKVEKKVYYSPRILKKDQMVPNFDYDNFKVK